jgi:hypothetical protein
MGKFDMKKHLREARRDYKLKLGDLMDLALENYKKY